MVEDSRHVLQFGRPSLELNGAVQNKAGYEITLTAHAGGNLDTPVDSVERTHLSCYYAHELTNHREVECKSIKRK